MYDFGDSLRRGYNPATKLIILANVVSFVICLITDGIRVSSLAQFLSFTPQAYLSQPWTIFTYPLVTPPSYQNSVFGLIFAAYWLWIVGGSLERGWGTRIYAWFFFLVSAITALGLLAGYYVTGAQVGLFGLLMPVAAVTIAWATLNPEQQMMFWFVIPLKAKYLAWLTVVLVLLNHRWPLGIFALAGCLASWRYVHWRWRSPSHRTPVIRIRGTRLRRLSPFFWLKDYRERKRLKKLFGEDKSDRDRWM